MDLCAITEARFRRENSDNGSCRRRGTTNEIRERNPSVDATRRRRRDARRLRARTREPQAANEHTQSHAPEGAPTLHCHCR